MPGGLGELHRRGEIGVDDAPRREQQIGDDDVAGVVGVALAHDAEILLHRQVGTVQDRRQPEVGVWNSQPSWLAQLRHLRQVRHEPILQILRVIIAEPEPQVAGVGVAARFVHRLPQVPTVAVAPQAGHHDGPLLCIARPVLHVTSVHVHRVAEAGGGHVIEARKSTSTCSSSRRKRSAATSARSAARRCTSSRSSPPSASSGTSISGPQLTHARQYSRPRFFRADAVECPSSFPRSEPGARRYLRTRSEPAVPHWRMSESICRGAQTLTRFERRSHSRLKDGLLCSRATMRLVPIRSLRRAPDPLSDCTILPTM
mmetsp:Transcript_38830/g.116227  ORF Transcript_38830/g.116227 Transcript_38830/m.116227 type:complete len:315 (-) Transcript_38830:708-1652(-)